MRIDPNDTAKNAIDCKFPAAVGPKANPRCWKLAFKVQSAGSQRRLRLLYQSVLIDSFWFAHYGTVIKIDFWQLYLLQQERCLFRSSAKHCFVFSSLELRKRDRKNWLPCFPRNYIWTLTAPSWSVTMQIQMYSV